MPLSLQVRIWHAIVKVQRLRYSTFCTLRKIRKKAAHELILLLAEIGFLFIDGIRSFPLKGDGLPVFLNYLIHKGRKCRKRGGRFPVALGMVIDVLQIEFLEALQHCLRIKELAARRPCALEHLSFRE